MSIVPPPSQPASLAETLSIVDAVLASIGHRLPVQASREDLASAGKLALIEALLRFDGPAAEARAYCFVRVRGAVFDELRRLDPLSRHARAQIRLVRRAAEALESQLGRKPWPTELARVTGLTVPDLTQLEQLALNAQACAPDEDGARGEAAANSGWESVADPAAACPARSAESGETSDGIRAALSRLAPNHARVLQRYYLDDATLEEISTELGVSKERVRQIREAAEKRLREDFVVLALWQSLLNRR